MILNTLIEQQNRLVQAIVEIQLIPGIPQIHFLGLPDKVIKESFFRIKAAMKSSGFKFPISQQVIVNIRPSSLKKSSQGLELAVALGILHLTGQKILCDRSQQHLIYGELDLDGGVREPEDLIYFKNIHKDFVLTGKSLKQTQNFSRLEHLKDEIQLDESQKPVEKLLKRPEMGLDKKFSRDEAELIFLLSTSGLHGLIAGQSGAGKSFLAKNFISFYDPKHDVRPDDQDWYPIIAPHHSLTAGAFLGGGVQLSEGEIEKVENGVLVLDELLEFHSQILESLREPMTGEPLRIARAGRVKEIKPLFQVIATSNFCPCGKWVPGYDLDGCRFSAVKCRSHLNRLTGPLVDRFGLIYFHTLRRPKREITGREILKRIENWNGKAIKNPLKADLDFIDSIYGELSGRRQQALAKVAEIYAIEENSREITVKHLKKSESWTISGFAQLEKGMS
ncbi:competence protein ComM [Bdellovibrio sp. qaytius]|nr:competence protein ComM [Bdellovibrio sp. qaytius]